MLMHQEKKVPVNVTVFGSLPNSCYEASIKDIYPGGSIVYIADPGAAQVFIDETLKPGGDICLMQLLPWASHVNIPDNFHNKVSIFINGEKTLTVDVKSVPDEYQVIALLNESPSERQGCSVVPADAAYPMIYKKVYGPASKIKCIAWGEGEL